MLPNGWCARPLALPAAYPTTCKRDNIPEEIDLVTGSADTKPILNALVELGLDNDTYKNILHHVHHSISAMQRYDAVEYEPDSNNLILHRRLEWMLRTYREEWNLPPGRTDVMVALARAAALGIARAVSG